MKKFDVEIKRNEYSEALPAGGYVIKILHVEEKQTQNGTSYLEFSIDIAEGDYSGFYRKAYAADDRPDKKWRGEYKLWIPDESGQYFESSKKRFGNAIACIEESNPGFHWDWDEKKLKDKIVGGLFREEEYEKDGESRWVTKCFSLIPAEDVRSGNYREPKPKELKNKPVSPNPLDSGFIAEIKDLEDDLPF